MEYHERNSLLTLRNKIEKEQEMQRTEYREEKYPKNCVGNKESTHPMFGTANLFYLGQMCAYKTSGGEVKICLLIQTAKSLLWEYWNAVRMAWYSEGENLFSEWHKDRVAIQVKYLSPSIFNFSQAGHYSRLVYILFTSGKWSCKTSQPQGFNL